VSLDPIDGPVDPLLSFGWDEVSIFVEEKEGIISVIRLAQGLSLCGNGCPPPIRKAG